jgi:voltage-gated potassium channel
MTFGRQTAGTALRSRIAIYGAGASLLVIYLCALAVLDVERGAPGANIQDFGDAMWWAFVTATTIGYGDFYPVTALGRIWAVGLMVGGIAILGTVTATVSSWVIEKAARGRDDDEPATRGQVRALVQQVTQMHQELAPPAREEKSP